jgi:hypothetical protein
MSDTHNTTAVADAPVVAEPAHVQPETTTEAPAVLEEASAANPATAADAAPVVAEEPAVAAAASEEIKAIDSGILGYKAPGLIKLVHLSTCCH